jgi:hypothetical protein
MEAGGEILLGRYLEVTGAFGFGEKDGLVVNEAFRVKSGDRKLSSAVSRVVGFTVKNCMAPVSDALVPQSFTVPVRRWESGGGGVYTPREDVVVLNPGDSAIFESCDFFAYMLNNKETHGLILANGCIKRSSRGTKSIGDLSRLTTYTVDEAGYYCFAFSPRCKLRLHDPSIKKSVGYKQGDAWRVKDEYKQYFGFLEMRGVHARRIRRIVQRQVADRIRAGYQLAQGG